MSDVLDGLQALLDDLSEDERRVSAEAFHSLLDGAPARLEALPSVLGLPEDAVRAAVARLVDLGTMLVDAETDAIVGTRGLSLVPTPHALTLAARRLYAFCAIDAIGIPLALDLAADVSSRCHRCNMPIALTVDTGRVHADPISVVIWAAERDVRRSLKDHT